MTARVAVLALLGGLLVAVGGSATSAGAAPVVPCVRTFAGTVGAIAADTANETPTDGATATVFTATVPASSNVEDLDVTINATHGRAADLRFDLDPTTGADPDNSKRTVVMNRTPASGVQVAPLTFDDEAAAEYTATSPAGRYQPFEALSEYDGTPAGGIWRLIAYNWSATTAAEVNSWSVTITYTVCDGDGDGAEEHVDNCVGLANPDQADLDGDRIGDPCDDDVDGDAAPNAKDNCLVVPNSSQSDLDGDGSGDACDDDRDGDGVGIGDNCPTVPNPDQLATDGDSVGDACDVDDDGDDVPDTGDGCPVLRADSTSGCPVAVSKLTMKHKGKVLKGRLSVDLPGCRTGREVSVFKVRKGKDRRIARAEIRSSGAFKVKLKRRTGKMYATAPVRVLADVAECSAAKSRKVTVRRR